MTTLDHPIYMAQAADGSTIAESLDSSEARTQARRYAYRTRAQTRLVDDSGRVHFETWRGNVFAISPDGTRRPMFPSLPDRRFTPDVPLPEPSEDALAAAEAASWVDWLRTRPEVPKSRQGDTEHTLVNPALWNQLLDLAHDPRWVEAVTEVSSWPLRRRARVGWDEAHEVAWEVWKASNHGTQLTRAAMEAHTSPHVGLGSALQPQRP